MAEIPMEGMIGNASSQIGQGLAYVLPETRSDKYFLQQSLDQRDQAYRQMLANQEAQQRRSELIDKTLRDKYSSPEAWQPFNKSIGDKWNNWTRDAIALKSKGIDPTMDAKSLEKYNEIKGMAEYANGIKEQYTKLQSALLTNPDKYSADDIRRLESEYQEVLQNPEQWYQGSRNFSGLSAKPATFSEFLKGMKGVEQSSNDGRVKRIGPDSTANKAQVLNKLMSDPQTYASEAKRQFGVNTGILPYTVGGEITLDDGRIKQLTESIMNGQRKNEYLEKAGIDPQDEFAGERLFDHIKSTNVDWDTMASTLARNLDAQVGTTEERVFTAERLANERARIGIAQQNANTSARRLALSESNASKNNKKESTRASLITDIQKQNPQALGRLDIALGEIVVNGVKAKREFDKNGNLNILIPEEVESGSMSEKKKEVKYRRHVVGKSGESVKGKDIINSVLNRSKSFGQEKQLTVNPYEEELDWGGGSEDVLDW